MVPLSLGFDCLLLLCWSGTYTTLSGGVLEKRVLFFPWKTIAVDEITKVLPHRRHGKPRYGMVLIVCSKGGDRLTLQPNHPEPFLAMLRQQASQAEFLV